MPLLDRLLGRRTSTALAEALVARLPRRGSLVASAAILRPEEGKKLAKSSKSRAWQKASFGYARALPEVGYALRFLTNNSAHIRLYVGDRPPGVDQVAELDDGYGWLDDERTDPDPDALPADLVDAARAALDLLTGSSPTGGGRTILGPIVRGYETVGEAYLVGRLLPAPDGRTLREEWAVHSISEVMWQDGRYRGADGLVNPDARGYFRLVTGEGRDAEAIDLDPATTTVIRLWTADAEWSSEPDSPMRSLVGVCERLLLIERGDDATFRSRAAGNGVLLWPEELDAIPEDDEEEEDETAADLNRQLTTPLTLDGSAAQVVPWLYRGASMYLDKIRHLTFGRPLDPVVSERESRLLARLGIGLDVPPEVIAGLGATNHWNAAQITSDTFRHHQEPITIAAVEGLTLGYLRYRLESANRWPVELIRRLVIWYDPSGLVAPADMRDAANDAKDRGAITDEAYRTALGFDESAAPPQEQAASDAPVGDTGMLADRLAKVSEIAGNLLRAGYQPEAVSHALGLQIAHTGMVPVTVKAPDDPAALGPTAPPAIAPPPPPPPAEDPPAEDPPAGQTASAAVIVASAPTDEQRRLSRRLTQVEQRLRERIIAAADAALLRALERAGNRARAVAQREPAAREAVQGQAPEQVLASLGRPLVAALGLEEQQLLAEAFARLRTQYAEWTTAAAEEALDTAARIAGVDRSDPQVARSIAELRDQFHDNADASWPRLEEGLQQIASERLYEPIPTDDPVGELPDALVPPGLVREALAIAGGLAADHSGRPPLSGLTSGQLLDGFLRDAGQEVVEYEWAYGISSRPFPPHAALDGVVFAGFDDDALSTAGTGGSWVGGSFAPGDHKGCHCDYVPVYSDGRDTRAELEAIGTRSYEEQKGRPAPARRATVDPDVFRDPEPRPTTRRSPTAEAAHTARTAPAAPVIPPPTAPVQARVTQARGRRRQAAVDEAGVPMRLDHTYLSALSPDQLDDLAAHVAARLDDANPAEGQRWDELSAFLDYGDEERRISEELTATMASDEEWQAAYSHLDETLGRPGLTSPRVGGRGARDSSTPTRAEIQDEYALLVEQQFLAASEATNGFGVTPAGQARGLTIRSLLTGDVRDVYRYATDELLDHLEHNRRVTWSEFYYAKTGNERYADLAARAFEANSRISRDSSTRRRNPL